LDLSADGVIESFDFVHLGWSLVVDGDVWDRVSPQRGGASAMTTSNLYIS
jgi:hypothetical protein